MLLRGLPFEDSERLVAVWTENEREQRTGVSLPDYEDLRDETATLASLAASLGSTINLSDDEQAPERVQGACVTSNYFDMIGEQPLRGRGFTAADDTLGAEPVVLIGYTIWQNREARLDIALGHALHGGEAVTKPLLREASADEWAAAQEAERKEPGGKPGAFGSRAVHRRRAGTRATSPGSPTCRASATPRAAARRPRRRPR